MNVVDLSRRLSARALRRLVTRYRRQLLGGASMALLTVSSVLAAVPAMAHDGAAKPLPDCSTTLPLNTPCAAPVTPTPAAGVSAYTVTLPGVGSLSITFDPTTNTVTAASMASVDPAFTASAVKIDGDSDRVQVTLTSVADPTQVLRLTVSVKPPAVTGGAPIITAKVKAPHREHAEDGDHAKGDEKGEHSSPTLGFGKEHD